MQVLRLKDITAQFKRCRSVVYADVQSGLWPRQIKLGARASGWLLDECEAVIAARVRGDGDDAIRKLVERLHAARKSVAL